MLETEFIDNVFVTVLCLSLAFYLKLSLDRILRRSV
jgi:hypothetical protein